MRSAVFHSAEKLLPFTVPLYRHARAWRYILPALAEADSDRGILARAFADANRYSPWTRWGIHPAPLVAVAQLLRDHPNLRILEFGAGYSTLFLQSFCRRRNLPLTLGSFEHQAKFAQAISRHLAARPEPQQSIKLYQSDLVQFDDGDFAQMFADVNGAIAHFRATRKPVPLSDYLNTRQHNAFYDWDFGQLAPASVDLVILDGPNGNGRSLAYSLLAHALNYPAWILVDDTGSHPFVDDAKRIFVAEQMRAWQRADKGCVLLRVHGLQPTTG